MAPYPYTLGNAFEEKRRYNYAPYGGTGFLQAWQAARAEQLGHAATDLQDGFPALPTSAAADDALDVLARRWQQGAGDAEWKALRRLVQHFEVGQRIYGAYRPGFVPHDRSDFRQTRRYLLAAHLFEAAYAQGGDLDALNALLKMLDLLSTRVQDLDAPQRARLHRLVRREAAHVARLAQTLEVTW
jgi:hypothetical protein